MQISSQRLVCFKKNIIRKEGFVYKFAICIKIYLNHANIKLPTDMRATLKAPNTKFINCKSNLTNTKFPLVYRNFLSFTEILNYIRDNYTHQGARSCMPFDLFSF